MGDEFSVEEKTWGGGGGGRIKYERWRTDDQFINNYFRYVSSADSKMNWFKTNMIFRKNFVIALVPCLTNKNTKH